MQPSRRALLAGLGAAAAAPLLPASAALPPFRRKVGDAEVIVISDGTLTVPISFTLPETPAAEREALFASHGLPPGGMPGQTNVTLVKIGGETVLIDTGSGPHFQPTAGKLQENMEAAGIDPGSVTKVVFTHGHADHLWGAIDDLDELRFPNASYVIAAGEWDFWTNPDTPSRVPDWLAGMARGSARILKRLEAKIERRRPGEAVMPGLAYVETHGHTPGHVAVMVESGGERALIAGDVLSHPAVSFARPDWPWGSDLDRAQGAATRKRVADMLAADRIPFVGFHLPWPGFGRVERSGAAWRFVPG